MNARRIARLCVWGLIGALACGGGEPEASEQTPSVGAGGAPAPSIGSQPAAGATLIADMRAHLTRLQSAGGDVIVPQIPEHTRLVNQLLTTLTQERPSRGAAWDALADSVRQDLTRVASMDAAQLDEFVDVHAGRVTRLMDMP